MALKKKPVTGMKDMMPAEMEVRIMLSVLSKRHIKHLGFPLWKTPCVETYRELMQ